MKLSPPSNDTLISNVDAFLFRNEIKMLSFLKGVYSPLRGTGLAYVLHDEMYTKARVPDDVFLDAHMSFVNCFFLEK